MDFKTEIQNLDRAQQQKVAKQVMASSENQDFARLMFQQIPDVVMTRVRSLQGAHRHGIQSLSAADKEALRACIPEAIPLDYEGLETWNRHFGAAVAKANTPTFWLSIQQLPPPPPEPPDLWSALTTQTSEPDSVGTAACLMLYTLGLCQGCA